MHPTTHNLTGSRRAGRRRGVVMIIVLLAIILLTALVVFVVNIGDQVNRRVSGQSTADATAAAGATWIARSLNTAARNNVTMSRYIALVNVLDSLPQAVRFTRKEQTSMRDALQAQLARGVSNKEPDRLRAELREMLEDFLDELNEELEQIEPVDEMLSGLDVPAITHYDGGDGRLWQALAALDEMNQTVMHELPTLAQDVAVDGGEMTQRGDRGAEAFMVPVAPQIPWERGTFEDFRHPVRYGTLPDAVDDPQTHRGPYDTLFGWHGRIIERSGGRWVPGSSDTASGGSGNVPIGSGAGGGSGGRWVGGRTRVTAYYTWGMHGHLMRRIDHFVERELRNTRLDWWMSSLSRSKLFYIWPGDSDPNTDDEIDPVVTDLDEIVNPDWIIRFDEATTLGDAQPDRIHNTAFFIVEIKSKYPTDHPNFLAEGTWAPVTRSWRWQPRIVRVGGWEDPRQWTQHPDVESVGPHGWREQWSYTVWFDHDIGIDRVVDDQGNPVAQPVHRIDHFWFAGVNIGEPEDVSNPYEGFDKNADDAPSPVDFNHERVADTPESRRRHLTVLGIASQSDEAEAWPSRFSGAKPLPAQVALAQAKVFNNHSWDLWTQMWHARLEPISDYAQWGRRMSADASRLGMTDEVDPEVYDNLLEYMTRTTTLGEVVTQH